MLVAGVASTRAGCEPALMRSMAARAGAESTLERHLPGGAEGPGLTPGDRVHHSKPHLLLRFPHAEGMLSFQKEGVRAAWKPVLVLALSTRSRRSFGMEEQMTDRTCPVPSGGPASLRQVEEAVRREFDAGLFTGAVVLLGDRERVLYHEAFGLAQVEPEPVAMRRDSIFDVASVTKVVATATACAICVDEGRLDPDAPLTTTIPTIGAGAPRRSRCATWRRTPGISRRAPDRPPGEWRRLLPGALEESPTSEPGARHEYACYNAILLGTIVERHRNALRRVLHPANLPATWDERERLQPGASIRARGRRPARRSPGISQLDSRMAGRATATPGSSPRRPT